MCQGYTKSEENDLGNSKLPIYESIILVYTPVVIAVNRSLASRVQLSTLAEGANILMDSNLRGFFPWPLLMSERNGKSEICDDR